MHPDATLHDLANQVIAFANLTGDRQERARERMVALAVAVTEARLRPNILPFTGKARPDPDQPQGAA